MRAVRIARLDMLSRDGLEGGIYPVPCILYPIPRTLHPDGGGTVPYTLRPLLCTLYPARRLDMLSRDGMDDAAVGDAEEVVTEAKRSVDEARREKKSTFANFLYGLGLG